MRSDRLLVASILLLLAAAALGQQPSSSGSPGSQQAPASQAPQAPQPNAKAAPGSKPGPGAKAAAPATPATPPNTATSPSKGAKAASPPGAPAPPANPATPAIGSPPPDMGNIDQILEGDEEVLAGNTFTYDPGNRRDPFKSLLIAPDRPEFRGPRPEGVPGLLIDEIDLKGIFRTARGYVAQVAAANQKKSYLLKEGDQLYDGDVVSIGKSEVVFKQIVQDPTALKPFREIVKSLIPK
jgi:hypothetical protein